MMLVWITECLKTGETWESGFCKALCSSSVVIPIISRGTFCDAAEICENSPCDNVILEFDLALSLNLLKGTAVMPLFVGDTVFLSIEILSSSCSLHMCNNKEELFKKHRKRTTKDSFISPITSSRSALPTSHQPRSGWRKSTRRNKNTSPQSKTPWCWKTSKLPT